MKFKEGAEQGKCGSCENAHIRKDDQGTIVLCQAVHSEYGKRVFYPLHSCSEHIEKGSMSYYEMKEKAWILEVKGTRIIGFQAPKIDKND